ncbi:hypothetical protein NVP1081O_171 [Vibrio phage 1.081.O._10N.286.52.C2]|nr:hypothetical protein NVP1081O_171 [Vibrio phage 1.081.O._10N.286.52.C2]
MNTYALLRKMEAVVDSCETEAQCRSARNYLNQAIKYIYAQDAVWMWLLEDIDRLDNVLTNKITEVSTERGAYTLETGLIKLGLDIHGVIDRAPELFTLISQLPVEIHIITGIKEELDKEVPEGLRYDHWFSIHQQCEDEGIDITIDENGRPWVDEEVWNNKKAEYCKRENITMLIDDSPFYAPTFVGHDTLYLQLTNTIRDTWRRK